MAAKKELLIKDTFTYSTASYIAVFIGFFVSILAKKFLGVSGAGYWALLVVVQSYGMYVGLGIKDALIREFPQSIGAGEFNRAQKIQDVTFSYLIVASLIGAVAIWILSFFFFDDPVFKTGMKIIAVLILMTHLYNLMLTLLRAKKQIAILSKITILNTLFIALFPLAGAYFFNITGFATGMVIATALSFCFAKKWANTNFSFNLDWPEIGRLLKIGGAMLFGGVLFRTFLNIDKIMIGKMLGIEQLGLYTIGLMAIQQVGALPRFFNIVIFPHIQEKYGATKDVSSLKSMILKPTYFISRLMPIFLGGLVFVLQPLIHYILPQFEGGLDAMKILVFGYFFMLANEMSSTLIFTINKQNYLIPLYAILAGTCVGFNYLFISLGLGIAGVALGTSLSYFCFFLVVFTFAARHIMKWQDLLKLYLGIAIPYLYFLLNVLWIDRYVDVANVVLSTLLKLSCLGLVSIPVLISVERRERLFSLIFKILKAKISGRTAG